MARFLRGVGWTLVSAGFVVVLYLVHAVFLTDLQTDRAQAALREDLGFEIPEVRAEPAAPPVDGTPGGEDATDDDPTMAGGATRQAERAERRVGASTAVDVGNAFGAIWF
ncbi:MAG: hypothetical protein ACRDUY_04220, partial [Nitriliruptorales bacterium]